MTQDSWKALDQKIRKDIEEKYPELEKVILFDDLAEAYVGLAFGESKPKAIYDFVKIIEIFQERDGMDEMSAIEWFEYNTLRTSQYLGEEGPMFINME